MKITDKIKLWLPVVVWVGLIFFLSSLSVNNGDQFSWLDFAIKKTAHMIEYGILYWLMWRAWSNQGQNDSQKMLIVILIITISYALSDEWHQTFVPGRTGTLRDVGFDTIGMLVSLTKIDKKI